jgi:hypothetical protein
MGDGDLAVRRRAFMRTSALFLTVAAAAIATPAGAHPKLLSSNPAADAAAAGISNVQLTFSEQLVGPFSRLEVAMTDMPGMRMHSPMTIQGKITLSADGKTLAISFAKPLPTGTYKVGYQVVSTDTHKIQGGYSFKVR